MKRTLSHVIGDKAVRILMEKLPDAWICREIPKDYGIDLEAELVDGDIVTGARLWFQVKGTRCIKTSERVPYSVHTKHRTSSVQIKHSLCVKFQLETAMLRYALQCDFPVLLVVVDVKTSVAYWLPLRDHIEMILDQTNPGWGSQTKVTIFIPTENCLSQEQGSNFEGLRWYAMEMPRMRAFVILSNYHQWFSLLCKDIRHIADTSEDIPTQRAKLAQQFFTAMSYLTRALNIECLFGSRGVDFLDSTKQRIHTARQASMKALMELKKGSIAYCDLRPLLRHR